MSLVERLRAGVGWRWRRNTDWRLVRWLRLGRAQQRWYLRRLFAWQGIELVLDVGANAGQFARFLRQEVGYKGRIVSFEPLPGLARQLEKEAAGDPLWQVHQLALGEIAGRSQFNVMNTSVMSSFLQPHSASRSQLMRFNQVRTQIDVEVATLDQFLKESLSDYRGRGIYLKLDVQGYEQAVLRGGAQSLSRIPALQLELSVDPLYEGQPSYVELMGQMEQLGYRLSMLPAHEYEYFPEMVDFDAHFVRRDRMHAPR